MTTNSSMFWEQVIEVSIETPDGLYMSRWIRQYQWDFQK